MRRSKSRHPPLLTGRKWKTPYGARSPRFLHVTPTLEGLGNEREDEQMSLIGTWNMSISTPIGRQSAVLELTENDGVVAGAAKNGTKTLPLITPHLHTTRPTYP